MGVRDQAAVRRARSSSADSSSTTWTWRGSLPCSVRERARALAGLDSVEPYAPPLGLRDDLVGDHSDVAVARRSLAAAAGGDQSREIVAGPFAGSGASELTLTRQAEACATGAVHAPARSSGSAPRVEGAGPAGLERRASAARSSACRRRARATAASARSRQPPRRGAAAWRANSPARTRARSRPAGRARARSCPCRGGPGRSRRPRRRPRAAADLAGSSAGQSPGTSSTRSRPSRHARSATPPRGRVGLARLDRVVHHGTRAGSRADSAALGSAVTTTISSSPGTRRSAASTSLNIAAASAASGPRRASSRRGAAWRRPKRLDRQDGDRRALPPAPASRPSASGEVEHLARRSRRPASASVHQRRRSRAPAAPRSPSRSSATRPSSSPSYARRRRPARLGWPAQLA